jgi:ComF family protein
MAMVRTLLDQLLAFIFPDRCAGCGRAGDLLCPACRGRLRPYPGPARRMPETLEAVHVGYVFDGALRRAVHMLKYRGARRIARPLGRALAGQLAGCAAGAEGVMAVPLHPHRLAQRGYNQAEELARELAQRWGLPLCPGLVRVRATGQQAHLNSPDRAINVRGAFAWGLATPPPTSVILVDDVLTTGATMGACAEALILAGANHVYGVALARSRPDLDMALAKQAG